jgi:hypothetical protein
MPIGVNRISRVLVLLGVLRNQIVGSLRIICEKVQEFEIMKSGGMNFRNQLLGAHYAQPVDRHTIKTFEVVPA